MELNTEQKIKRFHSEEIKLILFICATKLTSYGSGDLVIFTESIEGRIEVLFEPSYLLKMHDHFKVNNNNIQRFVNLRNEVTDLYAGQWHKKMCGDIYWKKITVLANEILKDLGIAYEEPNSYMENHLDIDW